MTALDIAKSQLLEPNDLTENQVTTVLGQVLGQSIDQGDLYFQNIRQESFLLEDRIIKEGGYHIDQGVGVRAIVGEKTGFAYADDLMMPALNQAAKAARSIADRHQVAALKTHKAPIKMHQQQVYCADDPLTSLAYPEKFALLKQIDDIARQADPRVVQVMASLSGSFETILIVDRHLQLHADIRPLVRLNVNVIVEENGRRESGSAGGGGRFTYPVLLKNNAPETYAHDAVRRALVNLAAKPAPAGMMPVVLGPGWPGVLLHEAVGHGLEGDFNRKQSSTYAGCLGTQVASPLVTIVDDGTLADRRGSLNIDDEGTPTQRTMLIEKGILKGYMQDSLNARLMNVAATGNGRRESYAHIPMPRMTNTFMLPGHHLPEEIIASVKRGIYAVNFGGGSVDITSGKFVFSANEAYLIEDGKVVHPIKGATLIGNGPDTMNQVDMVGNDLQLDSGVGVCGKEGQSVPVGVGQPTLRIKQMTVGGTQ